MENPEILIVDGFLDQGGADLDQPATQGLAENDVFRLDIPQWRLGVVIEAAGAPATGLYLVDNEGNPQPRVQRGQGL